jgi:hypothetical protein
MRGEPASSFSLWEGRIPPPSGGNGRGERRGRDLNPARSPVREADLWRGFGGTGRFPEVPRFVSERRGRDLNPRRTFQHVRDFQSRSLGHSDTSPCREAEKEGFEPSINASRGEKPTGHQQRPRFGLPRRCGPTDGLGWILGGCSTFLSACASFVSTRSWAVCFSRTEGGIWERETGLVPCRLSASLDVFPDYTRNAAIVRATAPACDFCRAPCPRSQRRWLMWKTECGDDVVLADLCARCASHADQLLEVYGGRGRSSMRVTGPATEDVVPLAVVRRASGMLVRGAIYVLIALATFFVVTLITSRD